MGVRHATRQVALQALYALDANGLNNPEETVRAALEEWEGEVDRKRLAELTGGCWGQHAELDLLIEKVSRNWKLSRMDRVDRSILRLGVYELVADKNVPAPVIISEAVELAKEFGAPDSPSFINGLLDRIARELRTEEVKER